MCKQIADMGESGQAVLAAKLHGQVVTCEGHALSFHNSCLLALQLPGATVVGGFRQWINAGRAVVKGQHGAMIWVPVGRPTLEAGLPGASAETQGEDGDKPGFIMGMVFDIGQTQEIETAYQPAESVQI